MRPRIEKHFNLIALAFLALFLFGCACETPLQDPAYSDQSALPYLDALVFDSGGSTIYGQVLVPSSDLGENRPCAILCHGFAGFTRWDDVAHDLCRAGIVVVIPHHRGAWGSEGEYTVTGCVGDAENLARWAQSADFAAKYKTSTNDVWLIGHSMGGNSVLNAAAKMGSVKGVALIAPCDIGYMAGKMNRDELKSFLIGEGLHVLHRRSDDTVIDDIENYAYFMRFAVNASKLAKTSVFLATGEYDTVVPSEPLDAFWNALPQETRRLRKSYPATHSLMGYRRALARDLIGFIQVKSEAWPFAY